MKGEKYHIYLSTKERNEIVVSLINLKAEIDKSHILAYFNRRNESEVIVDPKYLIDIEETQLQGEGITMI